jgi:hypothetical protein
MMRGLTMAVEDDTAKGEKARGWLKAFGVDIAAIKNGTESPAEVFKQIAEGLDRLSKSPDPFAEKKAMLDLFKRAGIEAIPVMEKLNENLRTAHQNGFGLSDEELTRFLEYQKSVTIIETKWDAIVRHLKEGVVGAVAAAADVPGILRSRGGPAALFGGLARSLFGLPQDYAGMANVGRDPETVRRDHDPFGPHPIGVPTPPAEPVKASAEENEWARQLLVLQKKDTEDGMLPLQRLVVERDRFLAQGKAVGVSIKDLALAQQAYNDLIRDGVKGLLAQNKKQLGAEINKEDHAQLKDLPKKLVLTGFDPEAGKRAAAAEEADRQIENISVQAQRDALNREARQAHALVGASGMGGEDAIRATYQIRIDLAQQLALVEATRIAQENDGDKRRIDAAHLIADIQKEMAEAQEEALLKQLELQKQQTETLKRDTESLWSTLLTHPAKFGKQLSDTVHAAVIKPVAEGMAGVTATVLRPIIYGADGGGGIASVFKGAFGGGKQDPIKLATDMNTAVTAQNSTALATLTAVLAGAMGMAAPAMATPAGVGGVSVPAISAPAVSGISRVFSGGRASGGSGGGASWIPQISFGGGGGSWGSGTASGGYSPTPWSGGGTPPFVDAGGGSGWDSSSSGVPALSRASGGGGGGGFNPASIIRMLGGAGGGGSAPGSDGTWGVSFAGSTIGGGSTSDFGPSGKSGNPFSALTHSPAFSKANWGVGTDAAGGTDFGSVATSKGMGSVYSSIGMPLMTAGLMGNSRGTGKGIAMGGIGGMFTGAGIGSMFGPMGTLIGAGVGLVAGLAVGGIEDLLGMQSPEQKAKQQVKAIYNISIDNGMAQQIANLAQSKYGGDVEVAVRDPETRKMLMLYAQGTGQKFPLSASTPVAGNLAESGGNLYQQASYVNGVATTFTSSLPVMGGLGGGNNYPTPGGPNTSSGAGPSIALNINGQPITSDFVADASMAAQNASYGRVQQSATMQVPGLMVGT